MNSKTSLNIPKIVIAVLLMTAIHVAEAFGQTEDKPTSTFKDRFISSAGVFFAQPVNSTIKDNYAGASFSPQLNLLNNFSDFSIAFASQVDVGYRMNSSVDNSSKLFASIPAMITFNAGHLASRDFYSSMGVFAGGGYDFCFIDGEQKQGVLWSAGARFWLFKKSFMLRYSQLLINESDINMRIISLQLNLGNYLKQVYKNNQLSNFSKPMRR